MKLTPEGTSTRLSYAAKASVGGKLAQIGSRLVDGVARKMADDFFVKFNAVMAAPPAGAAPEAAPRPAVSVAAEPAPFNPLWIVAGTIIVMLIIWWALGKA